MTNTDQPKHHLLPSEPFSQKQKCACGVTGSPAEIDGHLSLQRRAEDGEYLRRAIQARIKTPGTPVRTDEEWQEAEGLEKPCCKANSPCRHWYFSADRNLWINTLSKREREVA